MFPPRHSLPVTLREQLRLATRPAHLRLEAKVDFDKRITSLPAYRSLLEDFLRFLRPVEEALGALDLKRIGIDYGLRHKSGWLEADLKDLGHTAESLETLSAFSAAPAPKEPVEAFGVLYVLEGSSLGRQVMLRNLAPRLHISPAWAGRFFDGYGKRTGAVWRSFVAALNEAGNAPHAAAVIENAALAAFAAFEKCLGESMARSEGKEPFLEKMQ